MKTLRVYSFRLLIAMMVLSIVALGFVVNDLFGIIQIQEKSISGLTEIARYLSKQ